MVAATTNVGGADSGTQGQNGHDKLFGGEVDIPVLDVSPGYNAPGDTFDGFPATSRG
jgi:hypothetical protein